MLARMACRYAPIAEADRTLHPEISVPQNIRTHLHPSTLPVEIPAVNSLCQYMCGPSYQSAYQLELAKFEQSFGD